MLTVYHYPRCGTCKKALRYLNERGVEHRLVDIVESPPSKKTLGDVLRRSGLPVSKLFNTSGQVYREGNYKERLKNMSDAEAIAELATQGKLIKRPLVIGDDVVLVGFRQADYDDHF